MNLKPFRDRRIAAVLLLLVVALPGCARKGFRQCIPEEVNNAQLRVTYLKQSDLMDGSLSSLAYVIRIENLTSNPVTKVKLRVNGRWLADLSELRSMEMADGGEGGTNRIPRGRRLRRWFDGGHELGRDGIPPGGAISVTLDHDVTNHLLFKDSEGRTMPSSTRFERIEIQHAQGIEAFKFESPG